eukprot:Rhum_TRINITY_DN14311_c4_g1::Rhum_TRINITY_DN14311_c4_g1_i1::g.83380::m.83380
MGVRGVHINNSTRAQRGRKLQQNHSFSAWVQTKSRPFASHVNTCHHASLVIHDRPHNSTFDRSRCRRLCAAVGVRHALRRSNLREHTHRIRQANDALTSVRRAHLHRGQHSTQVGHVDAVVRSRGAVVGRAGVGAHHRAVARGAGERGPGSRRASEHVLRQRAQHQRVHFVHRRRHVRAGGRAGGRKRYAVNVAVRLVQSVAAHHGLHLLAVDEALGTADDAQRTQRVDALAQAAARRPRVVRVHRAGRCGHHRRAAHHRAGHDSRVDAGGAAAVAALLSVGAVVVGRGRGGRRSGGCLRRVCLRGCRLHGHIRGRHGCGRRVRHRHVRQRGVCHRCIRHRDARGDRAGQRRRNRSGKGGGDGGGCTGRNGRRDVRRRGCGGCRGRARGGRGRLSRGNNHRRHRRRLSGHGSGRRHRRGTGRRDVRRGGRRDGCWAGGWGGRRHRGGHSRGNGSRHRGRRRRLGDGCVLLGCVPLRKGTEGGEVPTLALHVVDEFAELRGRHGARELLRVHLDDAHAVRRDRSLARRDDVRQVVHPLATRVLRRLGHLGELHRVRRQVDGEGELRVVGARRDDAVLELPQRLNCGEVPRVLEADEGLVRLVRGNLGVLDVLQRLVLRHFCVVGACVVALVHHLAALRVRKAHLLDNAGVGPEVGATDDANSQYLALVQEGINHGLRLRAQVPVLRTRQAEDHLTLLRQRRRFPRGRRAVGTAGRHSTAQKHSRHHVLRTAPHPASHARGPATTVQEAARSLGGGGGGGRSVGRLRGGEELCLRVSCSMKYRYC